MVGRGISLFVVREVGFLPPRVSFSGLVLDQMIVVLAVSTAPADQGPATFHLIPAEYLADPVYPGLPLVLSPSEIQRWLAPPPVFQVSVFAVHNGYRLALVHFDVSEKEGEEEGGGTITRVTIRGQSYIDINGFYTQ